MAITTSKTGCARVTRMLKRNMRMRTQTAFANLNNDVLPLIFEQVYLADPADLLRTCLVSREFYLFSTHWLYRHIEIDFARDSHLHLLRRLTRGDTKLPSKIRGLDLMGTDTAPLILLCLFLSRLTHLTSLRWTGSIHIPAFVLYKIHTLFSGAHITINVTRANDVSHQNIIGWHPLTPVCILKHVASKHLTSLILRPAVEGGSYDNFKFDLVHMLLNNTKLKVLDIWDSYNTATTQAFPSMTSHMRGARLPQLEKLTLMTAVEIFTVSELALWGRQGGWSDLETLQLYAPECLIGFIGQIPHLKALQICTNSSWDTSEVDTILQSYSQESSPLGRVRKFQYQVVPTNPDGFIPWFILRKISCTITHLNIARATYSEVDPVVATPNAESIRALRELCPGLCKLSLDVTVEQKAWPYPLLTELALFDQTITVILYLHQPHEKDLWNIIKYYNCYEAFSHMVKVRKSGSQPVMNFTVEFKIVRPWLEMFASFHNPERSCWIDAQGRMETWIFLTVRPIKALDKQELRGLSTSALEKRRRKLRFELLGRVLVYGTSHTLRKEILLQEMGVKLWESSEKHKAIKKEIRLRKNRSRAGAAFDNDELWYNGLTETDLQYYK